MKKYGWIFLIILIVSLFIGWSFYQNTYREKMNMQREESIMGKRDEIIAELISNNNATFVELTDEHRFTIEIQDKMASINKPIIFENAHLEDIYRKEDTIVAIFSLWSFRFFSLGDLYLILSVPNEHLNELINGENTSKYAHSGYYVVVDEIDVKRSDLKFYPYSYEGNIDIEVNANASIIISGTLIDLATPDTGLD